MPYLWSKCGWLSVRIPLGYQSDYHCDVHGCLIGKFSVLFSFFTIPFAEGIKKREEKTILVQLNISINNKISTTQWFSLAHWIATGNCSKRDRPTRTFRRFCAFGCGAESPIGNQLFVEIAELTKLVHYLGNRLHS